MKPNAPQGSLLLAAALLCALPLLSGCILYPHRTVRSLEIKGTVFDARTHAPIKGAKVVQSGSFPREARRETTTDAFGRFVLPTSHTFHWAVSADGDVPQRRYYDHVKIFYPDYLAYEVEGLGGWDLNVLLQPVQSLEITGRVFDARTMAAIQGATVYLDDGSLKCWSDGTGYFRLAATPAFYEEFRASQASGRPFRDSMAVSRGGECVTFHCGNKGDVRGGNMLVQLGQ